MRLYKIQVEKDGAALFCSMIEIIDEYLQIGEEPILVSIVEMTEEEYKNLEEFEGF